ncbi:MAG: type II toxin-antitoxin system VapC family toxin [Salinisphaera sp.]|nr:type II toxin-antitoxin system VapC family toxin [Salinisphaera sp.]
MSSIRYSLDTNIVSHLMRYPSGPVAEQIAAVGEARVAVSLVVVCELRYGVAKGGSQRLAQRLELVLGYLPQLPLESPVEAHYADIRATLERRGRPIGPNDTLIAAHARTLGLTMVTDNLTEFGRVPDLAVENWLDAA